MPTRPASASLKIRHNNVLGYFVEVTAQHGDKLMSPPHNAAFIHRQTLAGQVRFTTAELGELEAKIANAADRALAIELETYARLAAPSRRLPPTSKPPPKLWRCSTSPPRWRRSRWSAIICGRKWTTSLAFVIEGGRHPVVEQALAQDGQPFVANDCDLSPAASETAGRIYLLTGPNMGGKSTFLRQNALIAVMAQMGSFVPARRAHIGIVDRLFSRVGAADDLARGRSTFMVEMVETAAILNQARERSLVILDEIGRGTATFDGLSIAWATIEHLHEANRCRALFATHFHELTALVGEAAASVQCHRAGEGMARRRGLPARGRGRALPTVPTAFRWPSSQACRPSVIDRAKIVLAKLEAEDRASPVRGFDDLPLFAAAPKPAAAPAADAALEALIAALAALHPDEMSPREALEALYALKAKVTEKKS